MRSAILLTLFLALSAILAAQVPESFNYQAVVRDAGGNPVISSPVSLRFSITSGGAGGTTIYKESHSTTTNDYGLVNVEIGQGTPLSGTFSGIDWSTASKHLWVEVDPSGGSSYVLMGSVQFLAVPYAMHAKTVENDEVDDADADPMNEFQLLNLTGTNLAIQHGNTVDLSAIDSDDQTLSISGYDLSISGGNTVDLSAIDTDTDDQTLELDGDTLWISDGGGEDVSALSYRVFDLQGGDVVPGSEVDETSASLLFGSTQMDDDGNVNHDGRLFFNKDKYAFRAGMVRVSQWDDANIGTGSFATGLENTAKGNLSFAMGYYNHANTYNSTTFGYENTANSPYEMVIGRWATNYTPASTGSWDDNDRLFSIGNGSHSTTRHNALTVFKDGRINFGEEYTFPTTAGINGDVLVNDGSGSLNWTQLNDFDWYTSGSNVFRLTGNVGIGSLPSYKLHIADTADLDGLRINMSGNQYLPYGLVNITGYNDNLSSTFRGLYLNAERTGGAFGTTYGGYFRAENPSGSGGSTVYGLYAIGAAYATGSKGYGIYAIDYGTHVSNYAGYFAGDTYCSGMYVGSDTNLKKGIKPYTSALSILSGINTYSYTFDKEKIGPHKFPEGEQIGILAQEVEAVLPGLVKETTDPAFIMSEEDAIAHYGQGNYTKLEDGEVRVGEDLEFKAVNYTGLVPILIQAVKEQQEEIEDLRSEVDELKRLVTEMMDR